MRNLFTIDKKNYEEGSSVGVRPSVRAIIIRDGKLAMIHSKKYDYYKFPGGGIEPGEQNEDTLVREVAEEAGLKVIRSSIREFGYVKRIEKGKHEGIFMQENFYYTCNVYEGIYEQKLDEYESEEEFTLEFVDPDEAINVNLTSAHDDVDKPVNYNGMIERDNRVMEIVKKELLGK